MWRVLSGPGLVVKLVVAPSATGDQSAGFDEFADGDVVAAVVLVDERFELRERLPLYCPASGVVAEFCGQQ
jgi:hypothetical protein